MDFKILEFIRLHCKCKFMDFIMKNISTFFNYSIVWMVLGVVLISFNSTRVIGYEIFVSLTLELLICNAFVKRISKRARPFTKKEEVNLLINPPKDYSFPSGHTLCAFMCAYPRAPAAKAYIYCRNRAGAGLPSPPSPLRAAPA